MMNRLTTAFLAGALAFAGFTASAVELPDYGSKNFSPPSDTPAHFANETAPVSERTADTTANDWSAVDAIAPQRSASAASVSSRTRGGRHGSYASVQRHGKYSVGKPRSTGYATQSVRSDRGRSAAAAPARATGRKPVWVAGAPKRAPATASKTTTAKHGKAGARQARAALSFPGAPRGGA
jgi:hypothetical protein